MLEGSEDCAKTQNELQSVSRALIETVPPASVHSARSIRQNQNFKIKISAPASFAAQALVFRSCSVNPDGTQTESKNGFGLTNENNAPSSKV
jgi:hypothetical protein